PVVVVGSATRRRIDILLPGRRHADETRHQRVDGPQIDLILGIACAENESEFVSDVQVDLAKGSVATVAEREIDLTVGRAERRARPNEWRNVEGAAGQRRL